MFGCMLQSSVVELDSLQQSQETVLMVAARKGRLEIVRRLIEHGARVNRTNKVTGGHLTAVLVHTCGARENMKVLKQPYFLQTAGKQGSEVT